MTRCDCIERRGQETWLADAPGNRHVRRDAARASRGRGRGEAPHEEVVVIGVESHGWSCRVDPADVRMYRAIGDVAAAVERLRRLLPPPGEPSDEARAVMVSEADQELLNAWVRYLYAYDRVYVR